MKVLQVLIKTMDQEGQIRHWTDKDVTIDGSTIKLNIPKKEDKKEPKKEDKKDSKKDSKSSNKK